jgi:hypothetical protein
LDRENKEIKMRTVLSDGRVVLFNFQVEHRDDGEHRTYCIMTMGSPDDSLTPVSVLTSAGTLGGRRYNKAMDKATALDNACRLLFPGPHSRPHRKHIWATFYRCLRTPDIAVLSGAPRYIGPERLGRLFLATVGSRVFLLEDPRPVKAGQ